MSEYCLQQVLCPAESTFSAMRGRLCLKQCLDGVKECQGPGFFSAEHCAVERRSINQLASTVSGLSAVADGCL